jgi:DNA polymerase III sliding clamp (beta) subunit (PCNA family)
MKITIDQAVLVKALDRGAMSALSDEAQGDTSGFSSLIKSVKITVGDEFVVESGTNLIATKWSMKATKENGIDVKEKGTVLVPAKELYGWVSKQAKAQIALSLVKLKVPEAIKTGDGDLDYGAEQVITIKKVGNLKLVSRDDTRTGNKWAIDCYESDKLTLVDFSKAPDPVIVIPTEQLAIGLKNVGFSAMPKDHKHIFDSIVLEKCKDNVYMAATDTHRCSLYKMSEAKDIDDGFFVETTKEDGKLTMGQKLLIPSVFLKAISKNSEAIDVSISYEEDKNKIYLIQDDWQVRVATVSSDMFNDFPSIAFLLSKGYSRLGNVPKSVVTNRLVSASLVNKSMVLFDFVSDKDGMEDGSLTIRAISENGLAPNVSNAPVLKLKKDFKAVWGVQHIMDVVKIVKGDNVEFLVPDDSGSVKVVSEDDPNLQYIAMVIDAPKYAPYLQD